MLRNFPMRFIIAALLSWGLAHADPAVRLPPGTREVDGQLVSGRGLRGSTEWIAKELATRGIAAAQIGPYRVRGVEVVRFVAASGPEWLAIHVVRIAGKTLISFVPRPKA